MRLASPILLVCTLAAALGCQSFREGFARGQSAVVDRQLAEAASNINKSLPKMVDKVTQFDHAAALPGKVLQYDYTLVGIEAGQLDRDKFDQLLKPKLLDTIRTNPDLATLRQLGVTFIYNYRDKDGAPVGRYTFAPADYQG